MKNVANSTYSEIMGLDEFLDRYTNPINREMYNELLNIFINKEEMDIFTSISEMISSEEQMEPRDNNRWECFKILLISKTRY
jgi:hypothetical protein